MEIKPADKTIYDSFNARNMTFEEVGSQFIPNNEFYSLIKKNGNLLLGPRGSGKTTLLKMLTFPALSSWIHPDAEKIRNELPYVSVYVPTDVHWKSQLGRSGFNSRIPDQMALKISTVAVTTNILMSFVKTIENYLKFKNISDDILEAKFCDLIAKEWQLDCLPCFSSLILSLRSRIINLNKEVGVYFQSQENSASSSKRYFDFDYNSCLQFAGDAFYRTYLMLQRKDWAICFDELELAPEWLQRKLYHEMRGPGDGFILKLSASPMPQLSIWEDGVPRHDFEIITQWPQAHKEFYPFFDELVENLSQNKFGVRISSAELFGHSILTEDDIKKTTYSEGSIAWQAFKDLASVDPSFKDILLKNFIDPKNPVPTDQGNSDRVIRKAKPIALHRNIFLKFGTIGDYKFRSRKNITLYSGRDAIYDICDGNPRLLIGIVSDLINKIKSKTNITVPRNTQARILYQVSRDFVSLVKAVPIKPVKYGRLDIGLFSLVDKIAKYFLQSILGKKFTLDPVGSFYIDNEISQEFLEIFKKGTYIGALILVSDGKSISNGDLKKIRFRLSYLLAPFYKLPLRLYDQVALSTCLTSPSKPNNEENLGQVKLKI